MIENLYGGFVINNGLAAASADLADNRIAATDGFNCKIYQYSPQGEFCGEANTLRPYRRLRLAADGRVGTALDCGGSKIYILDKDRNETGYLSPRRDMRVGLGPIADAAATVIGNERFFAVAFCKGAFLFDTSGKRLTRLCGVEGNELLTDFVTAQNDLFAMATLCGKTQGITVSDKGTLKSGILCGKYTLRMLIPKGNEIYGLFGVGYIYNKIIKIYSAGVLSLPR